MPFRIVRDDLTKIQADAIVNTANPDPVIGRGTDCAVYMTAGKEKLLKERQKIGYIHPGQAAVTSACDLPAKYIIHTVGPVWEGGINGEEEILQSCYENCLCIAKRKRCKSIAFPLIATGVYGFPKDLALQIVLRVISQFLTREDMMIYLVVFDKTSVRISEKLFENIESRIDDAYVCQKREIEYKVSSAGNAPAPSMPQQISVQKKSSLRLPLRRLKDLINRKNETFQQMLLRMISERGMTNAEVYKKANQDKKLFSKIKKDINYQPKKKTAMAFALALELNMDEAKDLLAWAGYAFSPSSYFDRVIQYCIETKEYNIYEVEVILYDLGLETLCNY